MSDPTDATLAEYQAAFDREWGTYVANQDIYVGTALAATEGHKLPVSVVEKNGWDKLGYVTRVSPAAKGTAKDKS